MYWRESARLAEQLGWRVINPSLPGFGGSDPLEWQDVSMESLANQVMAIVHKVDAGPVVLLGHSMGGAVAVQFAHDHPRRTLGLIYRDGVSTPAWKERTRHPPDPALAHPARRGAHGRHDRRRRSSTCPTSPSAACTRPCAPCCPTCARTSAPWPRRCPSAACSWRSTSAARCATWWPSRSRSSTSGAASTASRPATRRSSSPPSRARPVLWVPGRPQLDAGPAPGPGRHPHPPRPGPGASWPGGDRWRQLTPREYTLRAVN